VSYAVVLPLQNSGRAARTSVSSAEALATARAARAALARALARDQAEAEAQELARRARHNAATLPTLLARLLPGRNLTKGALRRWALQDTSPEVVALAAAERESRSRGCQDSRFQASLSRYRERKAEALEEKALRATLQGKAHLEVDERDWNLVRNSARA
jgi:hypothetical protein